MDYTIDDVELLARLLYAECRGEPLDGQCAVATVVLNRVQANGYPDNLRDVILQKNQFAKPGNMLDMKLMSVAQDVLEGYRTFPENVLMFQRKKQDEWYGHRWCAQIGAHNFYAK